MPSEFQNTLNNGYISQFKIKRPEWDTGYGFNQDSAFGANMVPRSNNMNPAPLRNMQNGQLGQYAQNPVGATGAGENVFNANKSADAFQNLMASTPPPDYSSVGGGEPFSGVTTESSSGIFGDLLSDKAKDALAQSAERGLTALIPSAVDTVGSRVTGSRTVGKLAGTGATIGLAASQGFADPLADAAALYKLFDTVGIF